MNRATALFAWALVGGAMFTHAEELRKPQQCSRFLVVSGQGYFPVALRLADGRIAVVLRGGGPHLSIHGRLDIVFSSDEGKIWSKPGVVVDSPADDRNPAFGQAADGTLVVAFWRTARYRDDGTYDPALDKPVNTWVTRSSDGGKTWLDPRQIDVSDIGWGSPFGRMLTLPDGTMLMHIYGGPVRSPDQNAPKKTDNSYIYRSTDSGKTWKRYSTAGPDRFNETALLRVSEHMMLAALRTSDDNSVWLTASRDVAKTWSEPKRVTPRAVHPADLLLLPGGRVLMTVGDRRGPFGVDALVGDSNGDFDWEHHLTLVDNAITGDCGYPSSVVQKDGRILTVYYATGSKEQPNWRTHCGAVVWTPP